MSSFDKSIQVIECPLLLDLFHLAGVASVVAHSFYKATSD